MKRIIKKVRPIPKWVINCPYCDTQFEYQNEDIEWSNAISYVRCPSCDRHIDHSYACLCTMNKVDTMQT